MKSLLVTMTLLFTTGAVLAGTDSPPAARTSSVAEMLQLKQEHQLREQLVREGRWDEVRLLDEERARRQRAQAKQTLIKMNADLARESTSDTPLGSDGVSSFCAPVGAPARLDALRTKQDSVSTGADTSNVR